MCRGGRILAGAGEPQIFEANRSVIELQPEPGDHPGAPSHTGNTACSGRSGGSVRPSGDSGSSEQDSNPSRRSASTRPHLRSPELSGCCGRPDMPQWARGRAAGISVTSG